MAIADSTTRNRDAGAASSPAWFHLDAPGDTLTLDIHVQPGASRTEIAGSHGDRLKIRLAARPVDGEANRALVGFLADRLRVAQRDVEIVRGHTGRAKTVRIHGAPAASASLLR